MVRILLYPDLPATKIQNNFSDNTYLEFLSEMIETLQKKRQDIYWYIVIPINPKKSRSINNSLIKKKLNFSNTKFIDLNIPEEPLNKVHFDSNEFKQKLKWKDYPIDLIFCHQPEITKQLKLFFNSSTNLSPPIIGYLHLFELPTIDWKGVFEYVIFGLTEMDVCYLNTALQKQQVHEEARKIFSTSICGELHEKLEVLPSVVIPNNITLNKSGTYSKIIVWNHEVNKKINFIEFQKTILQLRKNRDDFKVWIPMMKTSHKLSREYRWIIAGGHIKKRDYLNKLRRCCVGVSPKTLYGEWSNATVEGNECGIPYIMFDEPHYKEINKGSDFYKSRKELIRLLNKYLDDSSYRNKMAGQAISNLIMKYNIKRKVDKISNKINFIQNKKKSIRSKKTNQIINLIKDNKQISYKELLGSKYLNWNSKTKFDGYRKALLRSKNIEEIAFNNNKRLSGNRKYEWRSIYKYTLD